MSKIKLVFFDMEGTIFRKVVRNSFGNTAPSAWSLIGKSLGALAHDEEEMTKKRWTSGQYAGYVEWMEDTIRIYQKYGLLREQFEKVMSSIEYHPGVFETFIELRKRGIRTALISGGFKAQADRAQKDLKINHAFAACELFWDKDGNLLHWNLLPSDYEGKIDFMKLIMKEHGLKKSECAFVGDGKNDVALAKVAGISIAFNGDEMLVKASTHSIEQPEGEEDFLEILKFIL
ncbi:MAG: HAD-IB family phosphatase [archaeon]